jgi:hypothetical protein
MSESELLTAVYNQVVALNAAVVVLTERVDKIEAKFKVSTAIMALLSGIGGSLVGAWRSVKGAGQ